MTPFRLVVLLLAFLGGCGPGVAQTALTRTAEISLVATEQARVDFHTARDARCREEFPPESSVFALWEECMTPSYRLDAAVGILESALRGAQAALDIRGEEGLKAKLPGLRAAASAALGVFSELGLPVPDEVQSVLDIAAEVL